MLLGDRDPVLADRVLPWVLEYSYGMDVQLPSQGQLNGWQEDSPVFLGSHHPAAASFCPGAGRFCCPASSSSPQLAHKFLFCSSFSCPLFFLFLFVLLSSLELPSPSSSLGTRPGSHPVRASVLGLSPSKVLPPAHLFFSPRNTLMGTQSGWGNIISVSINTGSVTWPTQPVPSNT